MMDIQLILSIILTLCAGLYILKKVGRQFQRSDEDPLCNNCEIEQVTDKAEKK